MGQEYEASRSKIIKAVIQYVAADAKRTGADQDLKSFVTDYFERIACEDLKSKSVMTWCEVAAVLWHQFAEQGPGPQGVIVEIGSREAGQLSPNTRIIVHQQEKPFLLDSILMAINALNYTPYFMHHLTGLQVSRKASGQLLSLLPEDHVAESGIEVITYIELKGALSTEACDALRSALLDTVLDVDFAVKDWQEMKQKARDLVTYLESADIPHSEAEVSEALEFIKWIVENHFTFLGYYETAYTRKKATVVEGSPLGIVRRKNGTEEGAGERFIDLDEVYFSREELLIASKTTHLSTVHRHVYADCINLKRYENGKHVGSYCFVGLYTSSAYNWRPPYIPLLRVKVHNILNRAKVPLNSHHGKAILNIIETLPRDDIFLGTEDDLYELVMGILHLRERPQFKFFARQDLFKHYYSCFIFVPRDRFDSSLRRTFQNILAEMFRSTGITFSTMYSETSIPRIHFMVRVSPEAELNIDIAAIERILKNASRTWREDLEAELTEQHDIEACRHILEKYSDAFPAGYQEDFTARNAVQDIAFLEQLNEQKLAMSFYQTKGLETTLHFKTYTHGAPLILSDVVPMFEHLGLRVINEQPYHIETESASYWINDFCVLPERSDIHFNETLLKNFKEAFYNVFTNQAENDGYNRLIIEAGLHWRQVAMLRAYARYLWQTGFTYTQHYVERTLSEQAHIAQAIVTLFECRFDPDKQSDENETKIQAVRQEIEEALEAVKSLDQDRILRQIVAVILGTLRTNYYQYEAQTPKSYIAYKLDPHAIPGMPLPLPMFEIFVYSPRVEGVHLRGAKVARGGLRWSDRAEDYRTEVLGLVKAQQVKNAVIVPSGAKGGFIAKQLPASNDREAFWAEGVACYKIFIQGLLDLTDNLVDDKVVPPAEVVRYDEDDIYLVVAADKGTATFSDIANEIAQSRGFWLGDAFASGGSVGYDHKKMGITARGGWESVKRHFREMNHDTQSQDFTVVGIGDMSGDVFGNGMLLSKHIGLKAAFNHLHIFIDPEPDTAQSYKERKRLFGLTRSSWADYNEKLISKGGGIFERSMKSIPISAQMKKAFGIKKDKLEPNELIRTILLSEYDLLWNGGIGTYVKASSETHAAVGDKSNDAIRVNGRDLSCKVIGEGGNLGATQLGRIEFAQQGGRLNTDAIDNAAGVDCSDHEVNIKILLNLLVQKGTLDAKAREKLLEQMTDEVSALVLRHNQAQTLALSVAEHRGATYIELYNRLMSHLEEHAALNRDLEFLPDKEEVQNRVVKKIGLTRPELSVLLAYNKILLKEEVLSSAIPEDTYMKGFLLAAFPDVLQKKYPDVMQDHRLRREIIATQLTNALIDEVGISFVYRLQEETGAHWAETVCAYIIVREIFDVCDIRDQIKSLPVEVSSDVQIRMLQELNRLTRRGTRWFLRHRRHNASACDIASEINMFKSGVQQVVDAIPDVLLGAAKKSMQATADELIESHVAAPLAMRVGAMAAMFSALDIVDAAIEHALPVDKVVVAYFAVGSRLDLGWFREQIKNHPVHSQWDALARAAFRDDLDSKQRDLTISVLMMDSDVDDIDVRIDAWLERQKRLVQRWQQMLHFLKESDATEFTRFTVTLRELNELVNVG